MRSPDWTSLAPSACLHRRGAPALWPSLWPSSESSPTAPHLSFVRDLRPTGYSILPSWGLSWNREGQCFPSPCWLPLFWCSLRHHLPSRLQVAHCWLVLSFSLAKTSKSFAAGLLSRNSFPSFIRIWDYPSPSAKLCTLLCWTSLG